jgi:hypothetical protein
MVVEVSGRPTRLAEEDKSTSQSSRVVTADAIPSDLCPERLPVMDAAVVQVEVEAISRRYSVRP